MDFENDQRLDSEATSYIPLEPTLCKCPVCGKEFELLTVYPVVDETCDDCRNFKN